MNRAASGLFLNEQDGRLLRASDAATRLVHSRWLGDLEWSASAELFFPAGLPGFEEERRILPVEIPAHRPLIYLQSLKHPDVCFLSLPVRTIDPGFDLSLPEEDLLGLGFESGEKPVIGEDALCLALLGPADDTVQTNLSTPVVINLHRGVGAQCTLPAGPQSRRLRLGTEGWETAC